MLKDSIQIFQIVKFLFVSALIAGLAQSSMVFGQPDKTLDRNHQVLAAPGVTIYEHGNFNAPPYQNGRAKTLGIGDHQLFQQSVNARSRDWQNSNDAVSAIKVPPGFVAVIYEHAEAAGGYGA